MDGKEYLFFSGYSYLGMHHVPEFVELLKEGIERYGFLFPSSRISNTQLDLFAQLEEKLTALTGMGDSVCFSSGFLAGKACIQSLGASSAFFYAPDAHPAIRFPDKTESRQETFPHWSEKVVKEINAAKISKAYIALDSINPIRACMNDLSFLEKIRKDVVCIIDDSHGIGMTGENGNGVAAYFPKNDNIEYILTYSLSKAFNLHGGAVSCSEKIATQLRLSPCYTASTSISPAYAYAFLKGQHLYEHQRTRLRKNIIRFRDLMGGRLISDDRLPLFILPASINPGDLAKQQIVVSSFAYPDPSGPLVNRIVINALHTEKDLDYLAAKLNEMDLVDRPDNREANN